MPQKKKGRKSFLISMLVGLVIAVSIFSARGGFEAQDWPSQACALCDACFVPAALLLCMGLLLFVSNDGFFDMLGYGIQRALTIMLSESKRQKYPKTFLEYKEMKWGTPKSSFGFLIAAGLVYLALAGVFLYFSGTLT